MMTSTRTFALVPLRLNPGRDLRATLEDTLRQRGLSAAFVITGIGSLRETRLRLAGLPTTQAIDGDVELLTLSGTLSEDGAHLHMSVADAQGRVWGGHAAYGCLVRTTAEVLVAPLPDWRFSREVDPETGWAELVIRPGN
jgi:predicted DNA-binding protein with PD1-like motif